MHRLLFPLLHLKESKQKWGKCNMHLPHLTICVIKIIQPLFLLPLALLPVLQQVLQPLPAQLSLLKNGGYDVSSWLSLS